MVHFDEFKPFTPAVNNPLVSVIMPVYNTAPWVAAAVRSILEQSIRSLELIVIDDGSTDDSAEVIKTFAGDRRMTMYQLEHLGLGAARNYGLISARGKYVYFMDSDDILDRKALELLTGIAERDRLDVVYFDGRCFYDTPEMVGKGVFYGPFRADANEQIDGVMTGEQLFCKYHQLGIYFEQNCLQLTRREYIGAAGLSYPPFTLFEDLPFCLECMIQAGRVRHLAKTLYHYRVRTNSITSQPHGAEHVQGYKNAIEQYRKFAARHKVLSDETVKWINYECMRLTKYVNRLEGGL